MDMNPVGWFEIYVEDLPRATAFYQAVLQLEMTKLESPDPSIEMVAFPMHMEGMGASGALAKMEGVAPGGNSVMVYFACDDCANEESRVEAAGGRVMRAKCSIGQYGFMAIAQDTEGNVFGLHSQK